MGMERPERLDTVGTGLDDMVVGRNGSMYGVCENIYLDTSGVLWCLWVDSSFVHKSIYH